MFDRWIRENYYRYKIDKKKFALDFFVSIFFLHYVFFLAKYLWKII